MLRHIIIYYIITKTWDFLWWDKSTTRIVTTMCIISWKDAISFPLSESGNMVYPTFEIQFMIVNRCIPTLKSPVDTFFSEI